MKAAIATLTGLIAETAFLVVLTTRPAAVTFFEQEIAEAILR